MKLFIFITITFIIPGIAFGQLADSSSRVVHMQGVLNFRDAGGYKTKDGKRVKTNSVYRSGELSKLTAADRQVMAGKHIHTVVDFRGVKESSAAPDKLLPATYYLLCPAGSDSMPDAKQIALLVKQGQFLELFYGEAGLPYFGG